MDKLLINIDDVKRFRPISKEVGQDRFAPYVYEAQNNDLQPVLTPALFADFVARFDQTADGKYEAYQELLTGKTYTPTGQAHPIIFEGIKPMLVYYSLARFVENQQLNITRFGIVQKNIQESEPVSEKSITNLVATLRSNGLVYENKVVEFLRNNQSTYPLFQGRAETINQMGGLKFFDV
jgi:hypothetical protein